MPPPPKEKKNGKEKEKTGSVWNILLLENFSDKSEEWNYQYMG